jgi:hypothetical protein
VVGNKEEHDRHSAPLALPLPQAHHEPAPETALPILSDEPRDATPAEIAADDKVQTKKEEAAEEARDDKAAAKKLTKGK